MILKINPGPCMHQAAVLAQRHTPAHGFRVEKPQVCPGDEALSWIMWPNPQLLGILRMWPLDCYMSLRGLILIFNLMESEITLDLSTRHI